MKEKVQDAKLRIEELRAEAEVHRRQESESFFAAKAKHFDVEPEISAHVNVGVARMEARAEARAEAKAKGKGKARGYDV